MVRPARATRCASTDDATRPRPGRDRRARAPLAAPAACNGGPLHRGGKGLSLSLARPHTAAAARDPEQMDGEHV